MFQNFIVAIKVQHAQLSSGMEALLLIQFSNTYQWKFDYHDSIWMGNLNLFHHRVYLLKIVVKYYDLNEIKKMNLKKLLK